MNPSERKNDQITLGKELLSKALKTRERKLKAIDKAIHISESNLVYYKREKDTILKEIQQLKEDLKRMESE